MVFTFVDLRKCRSAPLYRPAVTTHPRANLSTIRAIAVKLRSCPSLDLTELRIGLATVEGLERLDDWVRPVQVVYGPATLKASSLQTGLE